MTDNRRTPYELLAEGHDGLVRLPSTPDAPVVVVWTVDDLMDVREPEVTR